MGAMKLLNFPSHDQRGEKKKQYNIGRTGVKLVV